MAQSTENVNMLSVDTEALAAAQEMINSIVLQIGQIPEAKTFNLEVAADVSSIDSVVLSIGQMIQSFVAGKKKAKELEEYFDKGKRVIDDLGSSLGNTIKSVAADLAAGSKAIGEGIADGVSKGLKDGLKSVKMKTKELGEDGVIKEFETTLEINSPSKVMKRIGGYIADGLGEESRTDPRLSSLPWATSATPWKNPPRRLQRPSSASGHSRRSHDSSYW
ncbi:MAG: hypothetical protein ACLVHQ_02215 [Oscillospiraceae bacterium]